MQGAEPPRRWWQTRTFVLLAALAATIPLWWPTIPPIVDLPGHMGRYAVELGYDRVPAFREWYGFRWALIGNLGVDLLIVPVAKLFGIELGVKLIAMATVALTAGGLLWVAREVHGRVPPTALFALPFAYGHPFLFGFINFSLAMALALCAFALWLRMARLGAARVRPWVFAPLSVLLWLCHAYGWGFLGVLAFSAELVRQRDRGQPWWRCPLLAAWHCVPMAIPLALMVAWRSGAVGGETADAFNWWKKLLYVTQTLRDRWRLFDTGAIMAVLALLIYAVVSRRLEWSRNLAASALALLAVFVLLPRVVFGSAYADMRLTPYIVAIAVIAIRERRATLGPARPAGRYGQVLAALALGFFAARTAGTTASLLIASRDQNRSLVALEHLPAQARVVSLVGTRCNRPWPLNRSWHLPALALVRRQAFSNDQWELPGAQLLRVRFPEGGLFRADPSQVVSDPNCRRWMPIDRALALLPRGAFDYLWLIDAPPVAPGDVPYMERIWVDGHNALYRIRPAIAARRLGHHIA